MKRLVRHPAAAKLLAALIGRYLAFTLRTTRWTVHGADNLAPYAAGRPAIVAFWHERLPLMPAMWRDALANNPSLRAHVVVSRHRDGRVIGSIMRRFSCEVLYGSTLSGGRDRGGASVARAMIGVLATGSHVVMTPDGPRGPRRVAAPGIAQVAAMAGVEVLPCSAQTSRRRTLRSWDRMVVPLPFGRGVFVVGAPIQVKAGEAESALAQIAAAMSDAADEADRLCP